MQYGLTLSLSQKTHQCLVIGVFSNQAFPKVIASIDQHHQGLITRLMKKTQKGGDVVWQSDIDGQCLLLLNCGESQPFNPKSLQKQMITVTQELLKARIRSATICLPQLNQQTPDWQLQHMVLTIEEQRYQLLDFKSKDQHPYTLESINFFLPEGTPSALEIAQKIAESICFTRTLANLPANICTPTYLSEQAIALGKIHPSLKTKIMPFEAIKNLGMGAFLAVSQGSSEPPQFIEIKYQGAGNEPPIVLVGKGITFDSGGLSIKPAEAMCEMKYDMAGAASVLGTLKACALLQLPINVIGLVACAENMLNGHAIKPGDIVTSMSGQTVEILNTDAEGRLILADALTYAERFKPRFVIDVATLTGAVVVALGNVTSGFMTNDEELAKWIEEAAKESGDKAWRLPLDSAYQEALESPLADMVNATFDRTAGSITAACFLSRFTEKYRWAHLDVAGTAWISGKKRNATGRPVPLLIQLLRYVAHTR